MKGKRVRFKDLASESNFPASSGLPSDARDDLPMPAAVNEAKTSEFAFFKKLKQDVGCTSCLNPQNREKIPMRNLRPSNYARELGSSKLKDVKSSQYVKKSTTREIGSFFSPRDAVLDSSDLPSKERDNGRFKCLSPIRTPASVYLVSFLSATANTSANPENQLKDGDIFTCKRLKLLQRIAKTLSPEADEVPKECDLVFQLLSRLLPESYQGNVPSLTLTVSTLSPILQLRQPETEENSHLRLDSNIHVMDTTDTSRMLVKADMDPFLDSSVSATQSNRFRGAIPYEQEDNDSSGARCSYSMLLWHKGHNNEESALNGRDLLTWGIELRDYSMPGNTSPDVIKNEVLRHFSYDAYDNSQSGRYRDQSHSYEVPNGSYDSFAATNSSGLVYKDERLDFSLNKGAQLSLNSWYNPCPRVSLESFRPSASSNLRYCTEDDHLNDFKIRREFCLLGWDANEVDMHDSTHNSLMELEIYCPPSSTSCEDHGDSTELCPPSTSEDHWDSRKNSTLLDLSPYTYQDHDSRGHHLEQKELVPRSPCIPFMLSYGPGQLNPDDSGLFMNISRDSSFFFIPQKSNQALENMICERNCPAVETLLISQDFVSDSEWKCKSQTGILKEQNDTFRQGNSSSQFLIANEENLAILHPEHWSTSVHIPVNHEYSFPLQLDTVRWKDMETETYDEDRAIVTHDNHFW